MKEGRNNRKLKMSNVINITQPCCSPCTHHFKCILTVMFCYRCLLVIAAIPLVHCSACTLGSSVVMLHEVICCPQLRNQPLPALMGPQTGSGTAQGQLVWVLSKPGLSALLQLKEP